MVNKGVLSVGYHEGRKTNRALKYRLMRRSREVLNEIIQYKGREINALLDVGTADSLMLGQLDSSLIIKNPVGLDFSSDLLNKNTNPRLKLVQGDAVSLPFKEEVFDVIVATAVIEHVPSPNTMIAECLRCLKKNGICIITTPDPFFEDIATMIGHLDDEDHNKTFKLLELQNLIESEGFEILKAEKFMMSPVGFPHEIKIERFIKLMKLQFFLLNQLIVCKKEDREHLTEH